MLIRSSLASLALAATLTSTAHCGSKEEHSTTTPDIPAPILVPTPDPDPRPEPNPEPVPAPKRVMLKLLPEQSACAASYKIKNDETGAMEIDFDSLIAEASTGPYRAVCRLAGSVLIPKGYGLDPNVAVTGLVKGDLKGPHDNFTGRLKFGLGRYNNRDFQLAEYKESEDKSQQTVKMDLKAVIPELPTSCTEDMPWSVSFLIETTINGGANARIEQLNIESLKLIPLDCTIERKLR